MLEINLGEYSIWEGPLDRVAFDRLIEVARDRLDVSIRQGGRAVVRATSHVGVVVTEDVIVRIRPKAELANLFYLMGVGDSLWRIDSAIASFGTDDEDLSVAAVRLFCREVERVTARGLLHGYVSQEERLLAIRGRVDLGQVMRRPWERTPVPCRFDEFVPDIFVNQALLAGMLVARQLPNLPPALRGQLHLLIARFEGVSRGLFDQKELRRWRPTRNDRRYANALSLASVVLQRVELADKSGSKRAAAFTIDMISLYEEFLGRELRQRLQPSLALTEQYRTALGLSGEMPMYPDFLIHPPGVPARPVLVADAKYKLTSHLGSNPDHYQLLAYSTVLGVQAGVLIYCERDGGEQGEVDGIPVQHLDVRNTKVRNYVYRLDISGSLGDIHARLDQLCEFILGVIAETSDRTSEMMSV